MENKNLAFESNLLDSKNVEGHIVKPGDSLVFDGGTKDELTVVVKEIKREKYKTLFRDNFLYSLLGDEYEVLVIGDSVVNVIALKESKKDEERKIDRKLTSIISSIGDGIWREVHL